MLAYEAAVRGWLAPADGKDFVSSDVNFKDLGLQLNYTKIRALSEGYITERLIEVGSRVTANG